MSGKKDKINKDISYPKSKLGAQLGSFFFLYLFSVGGKLQIAREKNDSPSFSPISSFHHHGFDASEG
jgi:hypothetical protein